jgi:hypothetical protein
LFLGFDAGLLVVGERYRGLRTVVERLGLKDEAQNESDGREDYVEPMHPGDTTGCDNVASAGTSG